MKSGLLIAAVLTSFVSANAGWAMDGKVFPGKGDRQVWLNASRLANDGIALAKAKKPDEAVDKFQRSISMYPYADASYRNLGVIFEKRAKPGDQKKAEAAYRKACELDPKDWQNWNALANSLIDQNRLREAQMAFKKALLAKPPASIATGMQSSIVAMDKELAARKH